MIEGVIILIDLDKFEEYTEIHGLEKYKPNIVTGFLTNYTIRFAAKHRGLVVYGLNEERGTEEVLIEIPLIEDKEIDEIVGELEELRKQVRKHGVTLTAVILRDIVALRRARTPREAYHSTPGRRRAYKLLKAAKRKGGDRIIVVT